MPLPLSDAQLAELFQQTKDNQYFGELYQRYYPKIYYYCLSITKEQEAAFDLTQEVFIKAAEHIDRLKFPVTFPAWLFRIAHNESVDHCKARGRRQFLDIDARFDLGEEPVNEESFWERERQYEAIDELMTQLGEESQLMLRLKYLENHSIHDLQQRFHLSESAVKMRLSRARNRIERLYARRSVS